MGEHKATTTTDGGESSRTSPKLLAAADRKLLKVELRRGETTYVSWKKLMKEATKSYASSVPDTVPLANPNLESHLNAPVSSQFWSCSCCLVLLLGAQFWFFLGTFWF